METPEERKLREQLKHEAAKIPVKPALGKIRQRISKRSPKDKDEKRGNHKDKK